MDNTNIEDKIIEVLNKIRPYLNDEDGDVIFNKFENGIVYVTLIGACANCYMSDYTLETVIEEALTSEIDEVIKVISENKTKDFFFD